MLPLSVVNPDSALESCSFGTFTYRSALHSHTYVLHSHTDLLYKLEHNSTLDFCSFGTFTHRAALQISAYKLK